MSEEPRRRIENDHRLDAYKSIFNHAWAKKLDDLAGQTQLHDAAFALCINWRAAANTHAFPWLMMASLSGFWKGATQRNVDQKCIAVMSVEIPRRMGKRITRIKAQELAEEIRKFGAQFNETLATSPDCQLETEEIWQWFLDPKLYEFHFAIWGSQRLCFSAIFHAYENFVREVIGIAEGNRDYKAPRIDKLMEDASKHFGQAVASECLDGEFLQITRLIRNALAHNGGRETDKLRSKPHNIPLADGILQIQPHHNQTLIRALERRSLLLSEAAIKLPQFQIAVPF